MGKLTRKKNATAKKDSAAKKRAAEAVVCPAVEFSLFEKLPEHVRHRIWEFACSVPRVVELHEDYTMATGLDPGHIVYTTKPRSLTRPPAVLHVCTEARKVGLKIYKDSYKHLHDTRFGSSHIPIYFNPTMDITYRDRQSDPFRIFGPNFTKDVVPLGSTRTLAVDSQVLEYDPMCKPPETKPNLVYPMEPRRKAVPSSSIAQQIMASRRKGVVVLIIVVGNDERVGEFELDDVDVTSDRAKEALAGADKLRRAVHEVWRRQGSIVSAKPPEINVMTVKRKPIEGECFHLFRKFPREVQNMIWDFASQQPRCIIFEEYSVRRQWGSDQYIKVVNRRQPSLLSVCQASRSMALKRLTPLRKDPLSPEDENDSGEDSGEDSSEDSSEDSHDDFKDDSELEAVEPHVGYYNKSVDIFVIPSSTSTRHWQIKNFAMYEIERLGMYHPDEKLSKRALIGGIVIDQLPSVKELTIVFGKCVENCEMTLENVTKQSELISDGNAGFRKTAASFISTMKTHVKQQAARTGKSLVVKTGNLVPVTLPISPYSY